MKRYAALVIAAILLAGSAASGQSWGGNRWGWSGLTLQEARNTFVELDGDTATGIYLWQYTPGSALADGTRIFSNVVTGSTSAAAAAEVTGSYHALNWSAGDNANNIYNALEGVFRSQAADESITGRGVYGRFYIDPTVATTTLRTGIGGEFSARASYSGGTEIAAESGTAFVGSRIWLAPYFSAATVGNVNNFHGLWIYGEHATQKNATNGIYISDAGGGYSTGINIAGTTYGTNILSTSGSLATISSGSHTAYPLAFTVNDNTTGGYYGVRVNVTETATGSGNKRPVAVAIGGTDKAWFDNAGKIVSGIAAGNYAASPQFAFGADGNSGWYELSADQIALSLGGVLKLTFDGTSIYGGTTGGAEIKVNTVGSQTQVPITFTGDIDCGLLRTAANKVGLIAGAAAVMALDGATAGEQSVGLFPATDAVRFGGISTADTAYSSTSKWTLSQSLVTDSTNTATDLASYAIAIKSGYYVEATVFGDRLVDAATDTVFATCAVYKVWAHFRWETAGADPVLVNGGAFVSSETVGAALWDCAWAIDTTNDTMDLQVTGGLTDYVLWTAQDIKIVRGPQN